MSELTDKLLDSKSTAAHGSTINKLIGEVVAQEKEIKELKEGMNKVRLEAVEEVARELDEIHLKEMVYYSHEFTDLAEEKWGKSD